MTDRVLKLGVWVVLLSFLYNNGWGAIREGQSVGRSIGVLRLSQGIGAKQAKAAALLERRLVRWFEHATEGSAKFKSIESSLPIKSYQIDWLVREVNEKSDRINRLFELGSTKSLPIIDSIVGELNLVAHSLQQYKYQGPALQRISIANSLYAFANGDTQQAREALKKAIQLHPNLKLEGMPRIGWENELLNVAVVEEELKRHRMRLRRVCLIDVSTEPKLATIRINGFPVNKSKLSLSTGTYFVEVLSQGYTSQIKKYRCNREEKKVFHFQLSRSNHLSVDEASLTRISNQHEVDSIFLIEASQDKFKMYLYTPGVEIDVVPLSKPIFVADLLQNPLDIKLPIARDSFSRIFARHTVSDLKASALRVSSNNLPKITEEIPTKERWYNNWAVWATGGAVVVGVLIAVFANQPNSVDSSSRGLRIQFE